MTRSVLLVLFVSIGTLAYSDQLAYISKSQAEEAAAYLNEGRTVYLFCGCCAMQKPQKVEVIKAVAVHTGYENYWEVEIVWRKPGSDKSHTRKIDLAYVWTKNLFGYKTLGKRLKLDHDYCVKPNNWDDPKNVEKDI